MSEPLNILIIEDCNADFLLVERHLRQNGLPARCSRVDSLEGLKEAIDTESWDLVLTDYNVPSLPFQAGLNLLQAALPDIPVIMVTGTVGEEKAVDLFRQGVSDFVLKENLARLVPAVERCIRDATERKGRREAEYELRESNERFRMVFEYSIDAILLTRTDGTVLAANPEACRIFGMSESEIRRVGRDGLVDVADAKFCVLLEERKRTGRYRGELTMKRGDGSIFTAETSSAVFSDIDGIQKTSMIIRDISERKKLEEQLLQSQKMEAVGTLAGGIAHDFNNILTAIVGYSSLLQMELKVSGKPQGYINNLMLLVERGANLTRGLLAFSRTQIMTPKLINLNESVSTIIELISRLIGAHIAVETHFASCPLMIHADCGQIEQVLMNLVTNARDAMQSGGTLTIVTEMVDVPSENTLQTDGNQSGRYARISVTDTGTGMDETTMSRIFEPFFTTKEVGKGTGLGLSILYGIIKQHHGIVTVASRPGTGTTFTIQLPLAAPSETAAPANIFSSVQCGTELILVAEDDQSIRTVFSQILQQFGYRVLEAADGDEAIETYRNNASEISLVILDMIMPRKNGKEVFNAIAEISPEVKTLFISGYPADVITQRELLPEGEVFLLKPVSPMDLLRSIRNMLDSQGVTGIST